MKELSKEEIDNKMKGIINCLGCKIKELRQQRNITQLQLAIDLDTDKSLISALERGCYKNISLKTLIKICELFEVDVVFLIR